MKLSKEEASVYGKRGGRAQRRGNVWQVEGESVSIVDMAQRLGVSRDTAEKRLQRARKAEGPLTWKALGMAP